MTTELELRINLVKHFINIIEQENDDPRQLDALAFYRNQLKQLEAMENNNNITIGLKPGILLGKTKP